MLFFVYFLTKNSEKKYHGFLKIFSSATVLNIDNNQFLSTKSTEE